MKRTISITTGEGSLNHNRRVFTPRNIDPTRTHLNVDYVKDNLKEVYKILFDPAQERYNLKQKRKSRRIDNYYDKIRIGKQEKLFYEIVVQIGNKNDCGVLSPEGDLTAKILDRYMKAFQERNPSLRVFSAHLHLDESTPHLHIDFVPFTTEDIGRGMDTRVSLKGALKELGIEGEGRAYTEFVKWKEKEEEYLASIMKEHEIEWERKGGGRKHLHLLDYKKKMREQEIAEKEEALERIREKEIKLEEIKNIEVKPIVFSSRVSIEPANFEMLILAAQKHILDEEEKEKLKKDLQKEKDEYEILYTDYIEVKDKFDRLTDKVADMQALDFKLKYYSMEKENKKLYKMMDLCKEFIALNGLSSNFNAYKKSKELSHDKTK